MGRIPQMPPVRPPREDPAYIRLRMECPLCNCIFHHTSTIAMNPNAEILLGRKELIYCVIAGCVQFGGCFYLHYYVV